MNSWVILHKYIKVKFNKLDGIVNLVANDPKVINKKSKFKIS